MFFKKIFHDDLIDLNSYFIKFSFSFSPYLSFHCTSMLYSVVSFIFIKQAFHKLQPLGSHADVKLFSLSDGMLNGVPCQGLQPPWHAKDPLGIPRPSRSSVKTFFLRNDLNIRS